MLRYIVICTTLAACTADGEPDLVAPDASGEWIPLIDGDMWSETAPGADPLVAHRGTSIMCPESAWYPELGGVEVETTACAYLSLSQPLAHDVAQGDRLRLVAWWQLLVSIEPAEAHLALLIDDQMIWEEHLRIPGPADARDLELVAPADFPAGSTVVFHLHNHGFNSWMLNELSVQPAAD